MGKFCKQNSPIHMHQNKYTIELASMVRTMSMKCKSNKIENILSHARAHIWRVDEEDGKRCHRTLVAVVRRFCHRRVECIGKTTKCNDSEPNNKKKETKKNRGKSKRK